MRSVEEAIEALGWPARDPAALPVSNRPLKFAL